MGSTLLRTESLRVNLYGKEILRNISLEIKTGEQWAVIGEAGSGKTVFAQTLAGNHAFHGQLFFPGTDGTDGNKTILVVDQQHRFKDLRNQSNFYYQQRYNAFDADATISVSEDLASYEENRTGYLSKTKLVEIFRLKSLLDEPLIQLSNGENKRLQILKAVLSMPYLLILDEPFTGLDQDGRQLLDDILTTITDGGQHILFLSSRSYIPSCCNRYAQLQNGQAVQFTDPRDLQRGYTTMLKPAEKNFPSGISFSYPEFRYAVRMRKVFVRYEGRNVLNGIDWEVEKGSCWALTGPNGAGKTTLLSLITADNPQAYANEIYLFDRRRGSGETIWEIKQKIGFLSPELQLYFDPAATAFAALASGLFDTIGLFRQLSPLQESYVLDWLEFLGASAYANRLLTSLPMGIRRLILLGRALIKTPPLLILDEPCQGLDPAQTAFTLETIDRYCARFGATMIFVSHYSSDFPASVTQTLRLDNGSSV